MQEQVRHFSKGVSPVLRCVASDANELSQITFSNLFHIKILLPNPKRRQDLQTHIQFLSILTRVHKFSKQNVGLEQYYGMYKYNFISNSPAYSRLKAAAHVDFSQRLPMPVKEKESIQLL
ncbi:hypothetical protein Cni_G07000 [Canna indica]|uniref:Uncharacterized protein n=1 Tax=Canna indica TaxID=4628 RepID=A0AAQ3Q6I9_9LILI|nr:hypothetical protein Cni_G07000 [Canna indica]